MKRFLIIILLLLIFPSYCYGYSDYLIAGGDSVGIQIKTKGILIVDKYDNTNNRLKSGDLIIALDGVKDISLDNFNKLILNKSIVNIDYIRNGKIYHSKLNIKNNKTGLYLKDTISGIGTLTFIDPESMVYGALGHEIVDSNTGKIIDIKNGQLYDSKVFNIKKSERGNPGEKNASFDNNKLGDIDSNTIKGIYGDYSGILGNSIYKVSDDINLGRAYILTELDDNKVDKYEIEITDVDLLDNTKNIKFNVKDKRLASIGGIVQGMSGSPIIQGDNIIGAVTHVVVDNPKKGYGISIINMLEESEKKDD